MIAISDKRDFVGNYGGASANMIYVDVCPPYGPFNQFWEARMA
jgi:hypothetical protein